MNDKIKWMKFDPEEWNTGSIQLHTMEEQGVFINICSLIWSRGSVTEDFVKKWFNRFKLHTTVYDCITALYESKLLVLRDGNIEVDFINKLREEYKGICQKNSENVAKRWAKSYDRNTTVIRSDTNKNRLDKIRLDKNRIDKNRIEESILIKEESPKVIKEPVYRKFAHLSITVDDNAKLVTSGYSQEQIDNTYDSIENYKKNKDYKSLYLTAKKWLSKEAKQVTTEEGVSEDFQYILDAVKKDEERYGKGTQWYADNCN